MNAIEQTQEIIRRDKVMRDAKALMESPDMLVGGPPGYSLMVHMASVYMKSAETVLRGTAH